jgi:altronate hydrolase
MIEPLPADALRVHAQDDVLVAMRDLQPEETITGRGTPLGFPAPTLKISSNSALAHSKPRWIDFDAGTLLTGAAMEERSRALLDLIIATASARPTCAERNGERELAIWKTGVTL